MQESKNGNYCGFSDAVCKDLVARTLPKASYNRNDAMIFYLNVTYGSPLVNKIAPFFPNVDQFTVFEIPDSSHLLIEQKPNISVVAVSSGGVVSSPWRSMQRGPYYIGFRSIVVTMSSGSSLPV